MNEVTSLPKLSSLQFIHLSDDSWIIIKYVGGRKITRTVRSGSTLIEALSAQEETDEVATG